jgi:16S rRNA processing protein RimM
MLLVAKGIKAHGIRGDIKINCFVDTPASICKLKEVIVKGKTYKIEKVREMSASFALLKLEGIDTMDTAEAFRDLDIFASRDEMPQLHADTYYIDDLVGSKIFLGNKEIGILSEILQYGSADVYVINSMKGVVMFPFIDGVMEKVDTLAHIIYLNKEQFEKVAVYED